MPEYKLKDGSFFALEIRRVVVEKNIFGKIKKVIIIPTDKNFEDIEVTPQCGRFQVRWASAWWPRLADRWRWRATCRW